MTWPVAIVLLGAMSVTAFLIGYLVHCFVYYRLEYEPEPTTVQRGQSAGGTSTVDGSDA